MQTSGNQQLVSNLLDNRNKRESSQGARSGKLWLNRAKSSQKSFREKLLRQGSHHHGDTMGEEPEHFERFNEEAAERRSVKAGQQSRNLTTKNLREAVRVS